MGLILNLVLFIKLFNPYMPYKTPQQWNQSKIYKNKLKNKKSWKLKVWNQNYLYKQKFLETKNNSKVQKHK